MHHHFQESDGGDAHVFEVRGVGPPWFGVLDGFLGGFVVAVEGVTVRIDEGDSVFDF